VLAGMFVDLVMVRSLAKLYNLPITTYETGKLFKGILFSGGSLLLGEIFTALTLGIGKSDSLLDMTGLSWTDLPGYLAGGAVQGAIAGYGAYAVGQAARTYLAQGNTWGKLGANTVMRDILQNIDSETIVARLREELINPEIPIPSEPPTDPDTPIPPVTAEEATPPPANV
jgi:uncharacterized protein